MRFLYKQAWVCQFSALRPSLLFPGKATGNRSLGWHVRWSRIAANVWGTSWLRWPGSRNSWSIALLISCKFGDTQLSFGGTQEIHRNTTHPYCPVVCPSSCLARQGRSGRKKKKTHEIKTTFMIHSRVLRRQLGGFICVCAVNPTGPKRLPEPVTTVKKLVLKGCDQDCQEGPCQVSFDR